MGGLQVAISWLRIFGFEGSSGRVTTFLISIYRILTFENVFTLKAWGSGGFAAQPPEATFFEFGLCLNGFYSLKVIKY